MLRNYESMVVLSPEFSEEDAKAANQAILDLITKNGGEIVETNEMGKRELAYEINNFTEGYYFVNYYKLDTQKLKDFEQNLVIDENILRYNILVKT